GAFRSRLGGGSALQRARLHGIHCGGLGPYGMDAGKDAGGDCGLSAVHRGPGGGWPAAGVEACRGPLRRRREIAARARRLILGRVVSPAPVGAQFRKTAGRNDLHLQGMIAAVARLIGRREAEEVAVPQLDADFGMASLPYDRTRPPESSVICRKN